MPNKKKIKKSYYVIFVTRMFKRGIKQYAVMYATHGSISKCTSISPNREIDEENDENSYCTKRFKK